MKEKKSHVCELLLDCLSGLIRCQEILHKFTENYLDYPIKTGQNRAGFLRDHFNFHQFALHCWPILRRKGEKSLLLRRQHFTHKSHAETSIRSWCAVELMLLFSYCINSNYIFYSLRWNMYLYSRHEKIRLLLPRIYTLYCSIWGKHFDASETWHDQIKVKEMEEIVTISLQTKKSMLLKPKVSTELASFMYTSYQSYAEIVRKTTFFELRLKQPHCTFWVLPSNLGRLHPE